LAPGKGPAHPARGGCCLGSLPTLTSSLRHPFNTNRTGQEEPIQFTSELRSWQAPSCKFMWVSLRTKHPCWSLLPPGLFQLLLVDLFQKDPGGTETGQASCLDTIEFTAGEMQVDSTAPLINASVCVAAANGQLNL
jgi:hypothetical protein